VFSAPYFNLVNYPLLAPLKGILFSYREANRRTANKLPTNPTVPPSVSRSNGSNIN
jgi:hypothetical protein